MYVHCMYLDLTLSVITYNLMLHVISILFYMYVYLSKKYIYSMLKTKVTDKPRVTKAGYVYSLLTNLKLIYI